MLPDIPTIAESGLPEYEDQNWQGFLAPGGTPQAIIDRLSDAMIKVARHPAIVSELESQASVAIGNTPAQFRAFIAADSARWKKIVESSGVSLAQ
jgi:tripartite-type tricarboxylate transporter receptor subunit TctC